ncbi:MAG: Hsp20/alpha crystallin family protein [Actinomycetota bacterium]
MRASELWDEMQALERRVDDVFRGFVGPRARSYFPAGSRGLRKPFVPGCDIYQKDGSMVIELEVPGIDPTKDLTVTVEDNDLVVRGERKHTSEIKEEDYYRMETAFGAFERVVPLPEGTTQDDIKAEYHDGLLQITVPSGKELPPKSKARAIPVKT